ncbi:MAG: carboxypeptidase-like regulatory domain-containing protein [Bacteroidales bacterium]
MLKPVNLHGFTRVVLLTVFLFATHILVWSQTALFKGVIKDEETLKPIQEVNIKVSGTSAGTSTDHAGNFSLKVSKIPVTVSFSCVGYETASYTITFIPKSPVEFQLRPKSYMLGEVDISSKKYAFMFKDRDYSVLDYELMGDNVVLLVFKYKLKQAELILLAVNGDTLAFSSLPEAPPARFFKDCLSNIHYFSKAGHAYQFIYNEQERRIEFYHQKDADSLQAFFKPFIFKMSDRLYFQEKLADGFGTAFGYYVKGTSKKYIKRVIDTRKIAAYGDDQRFYQTWNGGVPTEQHFTKPSEYIEPINFDFTQGFSSSTHYEEHEARAHQFEFYKMIYPLITLGDDSMAFFNFVTDTLEVLNKNGRIRHAVPIAFHKALKSAADSSISVKLSNPDWRWGSEILTDGYSREVYTLFRKSGMVKIQRIDLDTGRLKNWTILPFPFPEKIEIYKGDAYFLVKSDGSSDKWKLVKCKL